MHKTGTSSIQATLFNNKELIAEKFGYQYFSYFSNHGHLCPLFYKHPELFRPNYLARSTKEESEKRKKVLQNQLANEIKISAPKPFILSAEDFSLLTYEQVSRFKQFLEPYFESITIIIYVREPYSFLSSMAQQFIKSGVTFAEILDDTLAPHELERTECPPSYSILPQYQYRIHKFQKIFGTSNVLIREFNSSTLPNGDVVQDFIEKLNPDLNIMQDAPSVRVNEALSHQAVLLLEAINRKYPLVERRQNLKRAKNLEQVLKTQIDNPKFEFTALSLKTYTELIEDDVRWLAEVTNGSIQFDLMNPPSFRKVSTSENLLTMSAELCNNLALEKYNLSILKNFFIIMHSYNQGTAFNSKGITNILKSCEVEENLVRMSNVLSQSGRHAEALLFAEKVVRLFPGNELMQSKVMRLQSGI